MQDYARYIPHTDSDVQEMLKMIGVKQLEDLFQDIPGPYRLKELLKLPRPLSEPDLLRHLESLQSPVSLDKPWTFFLGAGAYPHFIPAVVSALISRSEFYTAYTPYQPEISQGTLQAIFEYQTLMCQLTGMEVSNASMYDGASGLAEAVLMAERITKRKKVLLSEAIHPEYRKVIETYSEPNPQIVTIPYDRKTGRTDGKVLFDLIDGEVGGVVLQSPNFFGVIEDLRPVAEKVHPFGGLLVAGFSEPVAFGLLTPPGALGADIVAGEGQSLGIPVSFGGPYLGVFTTLEKFVRQMPGRLVGETVDLEGKRGFVLTLATREQHIRREKATSNICTNEGLCALMATVFLSTLGKEGLRELSLMNLSKAEYAKKAASRIQGCRIAFTSPTFNEFVLEVPKDPERVLNGLKEERIVGGLPLVQYYPDLDCHLLVTVTEMITKEEIDRWAETLKKILAS
jgi:glycine dehydrogenase subunit 1